jgi:hypothetical protein
MIYVFLERKWRTSERSQRVNIGFQEFADFVFKELWGKHGIVFHDSEKDLERDLMLLSKLGIIHYDSLTKSITIDEEKMGTLNRIAEGMRKDPVRHRVPIIDEYFSRIEAAIRAE